MTKDLTRGRLTTVVEAICRKATGPGNIYLVGGTAAVWHGWREKTADIDMAMNPEPEGIFNAISSLREELQVSIELVDPNGFVPALPGWRERSQYLATFGEVSVFFFDLYSLFLSKLSRGHERDLVDMANMLQSEAVVPLRLAELCDQLEHENIKRFISLDWEELMRQVRGLQKSNK